MPKAVPIYPAEGTIYDNIAQFFQHEQSQTDKVRRALLGLRPSEALPSTPENLQYPQMVYKPDYFSTSDRMEQKKHYVQVDNSQELKEAKSSGFFSLADAKAEYEKQKQK